MTIEANEAIWREAIAGARSTFEGAIEVLEQRAALVEKRMKSEEESAVWVFEKAQVAFASAQFDLDIARSALADENAPGLERALARVEASLIEADPATGLLTSDYAASAPEELLLRTDSRDQPNEDTDLEIIDLTTSNAEEE